MTRNEEVVSHLIVQACFELLVTDFWRLITGDLLYLPYLPILPYLTCQIEEIFCVCLPASCGNAPCVCSAVAMGANSRALSTAVCLVLSLSI